KNAGDNIIASHPLAVYLVFSIQQVFLFKRSTPADIEVILAIQFGFKESGSQRRQADVVLSIRAQRKLLRLDVIVTGKLLVTSYLKHIEFTIGYVGRHRRAVIHTLSSAL